MPVASIASNDAARWGHGRGGTMNTTRASIRNPAEASTDDQVDPAATERRLRRVGAEMLGTTDGELTASISLVDDLAVDSLDLFELALQIEDTLDVSLPERLLAGVRTYGDLAALVIDRVQYPVTVAAEPVLVRARITPAATEA